MRAARQDDALVLTREVRVPVMRVAADDYADFARFCRAADEAEARELSIAER